MTERELADLLRRNPDIGIDESGWMAKHIAVEIAEIDKSNGHISGVVKLAAPKLTEHELQKAVIAECDRRSWHNPLWALIAAIPNGGQRSKATAAKLKAEGVRAGVPDLAIFVARHGYHGAFLELKVGHNKPTDRQRKWIAALQEQGYAVKVFHDDPQPVIDWIKWYLEG